MYYVVIICIDTCKEEEEEKRFELSVETWDTQTKRSIYVKRSQLKNTEKKNSDHKSNGWNLNELGTLAEP